MADRNGYIGRAPGDSSVIIARQTNQPTSDTSTFAFSSGYDVGYLDVYVNGSKLVNALDYTATDTQNVVLTTAVENGDVVEFIAYKAFNITNVITTTSGDLTVDGSITATDGTFSSNVTASGNVTAVSFIGDGSSLTGMANTNNLRTNFLEVSGISTFVGLVTANNGMDISGVSTFHQTVKLPDNNNFEMGEAGIDNSGVFRLYNGSNGPFEIFGSSKETYIRNTGSDANGININANGSVTLGGGGSGSFSVHANSDGTAKLYGPGPQLKLQTTTGGVNVTGVVTATAFVGSGGDLQTQIDGKTSPGKAIALSMVFG